MGNKLPIYIFVTACCLYVGNLYAKVSPEEAKRLGQDLTPMGAEKAGNADGSIPPYTGEILGTPKWVDYPGTGHHYPDPYKDDKVLFWITAENVAQYKDKLSEGTLKLFERYPESFKMPIYKSRRDTRYDDFTHEQIRINAVNAVLANNNNGVNGTFGGTPFPIPQNVHEVLWNHLFHQIWWSYTGTYSQAAVYDSGKSAFKKYTVFFRVTMYDRESGRAAFDNLAAYFVMNTLEPARQKGELILVHEYSDQMRDPRAAWVYIPGTRRVRRAPTVGYDNPSGTGGLRTDDDGQGYNGASDRYDWRLVGKKEMYIPYNNYAWGNPKLKYNELLTPHHPPPEMTRYELHRVWMVEGTLKPGARHVYARRLFYQDEDSWMIVLADNFDGEGGLWRSLQLLSVNAFDMPGVVGTIELEYDFHAKAYLVDKLNNEEPESQKVLSTPLPTKFFTPANLRQLGKN